MKEVSDTADGQLVFSDWLPAEEIKIDLQMNEEAKKKTEESMGEYIRVIDEVADVLQPIYSKLSTALNDQ